MTKSELYNHATLTGPTRVVINAEGEAVPPQRARYILQTRGRAPFDIVFVRDDGWSLGALEEFKEVAYNMWPKEWVGHVSRVEKNSVSTWVTELY